MERDKIRENLITHLCELENSGDVFTSTDKGIQALLDREDLITEENEQYKISIELMQPKIVELTEENSALKAYIPSMEEHREYVEGLQEKVVELTKENELYDTEQYVLIADTNKWIDKYNKANKELAEVKRENERLSRLD